MEKKQNNLVHELAVGIIKPASQTKAEAAEVRENLSKERMKITLVQINQAIVSATKNNQETVSMQIPFGLSKADAESITDSLSALGYKATIDEMPGSSERRLDERDIVAMVSSPSTLILRIEW